MARWGLDAGRVGPGAAWLPGTRTLLPMPLHPWGSGLAHAPRPCERATAAPALWVAHTQAPSLRKAILSTWGCWCQPSDPALVLAVPLLPAELCKTPKDLD